MMITITCLYGACIIAVSATFLQSCHLIITYHCLTVQLSLTPNSSPHKKGSFPVPEAGLRLPHSDIETVQCRLQCGPTGCVDTAAEIR